MATDVTAKSHIGYDHGGDVWGSLPIQSSSALMTADTEVTWGDLPSPYNAMQGVRVLALNQVQQSGQTSIEVDTNTTVYYAHDNTQNEKPSWLTVGNGWTDTTDTFTPSDGVLRQIWQRSFTANVQYDITWAHSDYEKRGTYLIGGFMIATGVAVTTRPKLYEVIDIASPTTPDNDATYWADVPVITGETSYATVTLINTAIALASPGAVLTLEAGTHSADITINGRTGITVAADVFGSVNLNGQCNLINATGCTVTGFTLPLTNSTLHKFQLDEASEFNRITNNHFDGCDYSDDTVQDLWIRCEGKYNRLDHNTMEDRTGEAAFIGLYASAGTSYMNRADHNHLLYQHASTPNANVGETMRAGNNEDNFEFSGCMIDHNHIEDNNTAQAAGGIHLTNVKSDGHIFWSNKYTNSTGQLVLRKTRGCFLITNQFYGGANNDAGGIRINGSIGGGDHVLALNYMDNLNSSESTMRPMFESRESDESNYYASSNCLFVGNIGRNCGLGLSYRTASTNPITTHSHFGDAYDCTTGINDGISAISGITFNGVVMNTPIGISTPSGITAADPLLVLSNGFYRPTHGDIDLGINTQWPAELEETITVGKTW
jgi:hypothetical protein